MCLLECVFLFTCVCSLQPFRIVHFHPLKLLKENNCTEAGEEKPKGLFIMSEIENENETYICFNTPNENTVD